MAYQKRSLVFKFFSS